MRNGIKVLITLVLPLAVQTVAVATVAKYAVPNWDSQTTSHNQKSQTQKDSPASSIPISKAEGIPLQSPPAEERNESIYSDSAKPDWWARIGDLITAIATVVLACIGWKAARIALNTLDDIKIQTEQAKIAAKAALLNAESVINSDRAWIEIRLRAPNHSEESSGLFACSIWADNQGRTVAYIESVHIGFASLNGPFPKEPLPGITKSVRALLGSGQQEMVGEFDADSLPDAQSILNGNKRGFLQIIVVYRHVFMAKPDNTTSVLYIFQDTLEEPERISTQCFYT